MKNEEFATAQRPEDNTPAKSEAEVEIKVEAEAPTVTEAAAAAEPSEQEQPEVSPAVFPQESQEPQDPQEEAPTPSPLAQMQAELEALRRENARLQAERELQRQLHRSSSRRVSDGQRPDIDRHTDEPEQPATARRNSGAVANSSFFTLHSSFLKPLALAAASVVACVVIYETGLLIPMGLIGLATSGLVK